MKNRFYRLKICFSRKIRQDTIMVFEHSLLRQDPRENSSFLAYMGISLGFHIIIMVCLIMVSGFNGCGRRTLSDRVIDVDLVSLPDAADPGGRPEKIDRSEPVAVPSPPVKKAVAVAPRKVTPMKKISQKVKTSLKKKTFDPGQSVENAIARLEKKVDRKAPDDSLDNALSRLRQAEAAKQQSVTVSGSGGGGGNGRSRRQLEAIEIYKLEIRYHVLRNWVFSSQLAGTEAALRPVIGITIAADGRITDTWFDRRSGNDYADNSAHKAVIKANPLPALPEGYKSYTVKLEFDSSDLR